MKIGNKLNAGLNGEYGRHVRQWMKSYTSGQRRMQARDIIVGEVENLPHPIVGWEDEAGDQKWLGDVCCESEGYENPKTYQGHPGVDFKVVRKKRKVFSRAKQIQRIKSMEESYRKQNCRWSFFHDWTQEKINKEKLKLAA